MATNSSSDTTSSTPSDEHWKLSLPTTSQEDIWSGIQYLRQLFQRLMEYPDSKSLPSDISGAPAYFRRMSVRMNSERGIIPESPSLLLWIEACNKSLNSPNWGGAFTELLCSMPGFAGIIVNLAGQNRGYATAKLNTMILQAAWDRHDRLLAVQSDLLVNTGILLSKNWPSIKLLDTLRIPFESVVFIATVKANTLILNAEISSEATGAKEPTLLPAAIFFPNNPVGKQFELSAGFSGINEWSLDLESFHLLEACAKTLATAANQKSKKMRA